LKEYWESEEYYEYKYKKGEEKQLKQVLMPPINEIGEF
jgi:hypothetical protein